LAPDSLFELALMNSGISGTTTTTPCLERPDMRTHRRYRLFGVAGKDTRVSENPRPLPVDTSPAAGLSSEADRFGTADPGSGAHRSRPCGRDGDTALRR